MSKKRNKMELIASILEGCKDGIRKTKLMYKANLSYRLFCKYTKLLEKKGLIVFDNNEYKLTSKGYEYLAHLREYLELKSRLEKLKSIIDISNETKK